MSCTIIQNPYIVILQAIWSIIKEVAQVAGNNLGKVKLKTEHNYEYNTNSGAGNPLGLLHPNKWGCGVTEPINILKSIYGYSSHVDNGSGEPLCGKFKNKKWKSELGRATCMFCKRVAINASIIAAYREKFARKPKKGQVYLVSAIGLNRYKIGCTTVNLGRRLLALQSFSPVSLKVLAAIDCSDIEKAEAWLHKKFASCRRHSEWFDLNDSDVQWIMSLTSLEGVADD